MTKEIDTIGTLDNGESLEIKVARIKSIVEFKKQYGMTSEEKRMLCNCYVCQRVVKHDRV